MEERLIETERRLTALEVNHGNFSDAVERLEEAVKDNSNRLKGIETKLDRFQGAFGILLLVVTGLITVIKLSWSWIVSHFQRLSG